MYQGELLVFFGVFYQVSGFFFGHRTKNFTRYADDERSRWYVFGDNGSRPHLAEHCGTRRDNSRF